MRIYLTDEISDDFELDEKLIALDDKNNIFDVYVSKNTHHTKFNTIGRIKVLFDNSGGIICHCLPLMSFETPYRVIDREELLKYEIIIEKLKQKDRFKTEPITIDPHNL